MNISPSAGKKTILILADFFTPAYKAGGAVRSLENLITRLNAHFDFRVITRDRDLGEAAPFPGLPVDSWVESGGARINYIGESRFRMAKIWKAIRGAGCEVIYLNSFFSPWYTLLPLVLRKAGLVPNIPLVLAPRGELSPGAVSLKGWKKRPFIRLANLLGLYHGVIFQASSEMEAKDVRDNVGRNAITFIAPDLPTLGASLPDRPPDGKRQGSLKMVFLSRVSRKKNLIGALNLLKDLGFPVQYDIYGPIEDQEYWKECLEVIRGLSAVSVAYKGTLHPSEVVKTMSGYDLFFFPTLGENFGHVILEAMSAGCPVMLSDQTPWQNLEAEGVGWAIPLESAQSFRRALKEMYRMGPEDHAAMTRRAQDFARRHLEDPEVEKSNIRLFKEAVL